MSIKTVAITGGTGFIGSVITKNLLERGYYVRSLIRCHHKPSDMPSLHCVQGDLEDEDSLKELLIDAQALIHCAGAVRGLNKADFFKVNVDGLKNVLYAMQNSATNATLIHISSLAAREPHLSYYAESKKVGETLLTKTSNLKWTIFRPPAVYGPGDQEVLPLFKTTQKGIAPVIGGNHARFSLLYVEDLANAVINALHDKRYAYKIFELDDGMPGGYSWPKVCSIISKLYNRRVLKLPIPKTLMQVLAALNMLVSKITKIKPMFTLGKVRELMHPNWVCNTTDIIYDTSWKPHVQLEQGLLKTLT